MESLFTLCELPKPVYRYLPFLAGKKEKCMKLRSVFCVAIAAVGMWMVPLANAQGVTPYLGEIRFVAFNFAPQGWALCNGQLLPISQNAALFNLLGTTYGGDGKTNFALPNLQGRMPLAKGEGPSGASYFLGQTGGQTSVTLSVAQMPKHSHSLHVSSTTANTKAPAGAVSAGDSGLATYSSLAPDAVMSSKSIGTSGGTTPVPTMPPYLGLTCIIALEGVYPTQN
jgi:microcystin-dependent protein